MNITIIVATDLIGTIGKQGRIPWRLKADMDHFKKVTGNHVVVMGQKTYESLPEKFRPLPDRINVVLTKDPEFKAIGCDVMYSVDEVFSAYGNQEIFVMGGGEIYKLFSDYASRLLITTVITVIPDGDTFFKIPGRKLEWRRSILFRKEPDEQNQFAFYVTEYTEGG